MNRKVRSDRKRDIKPTVSNELKECVYRLSYVLDKPIKDIIENLLLEGSQRESTISHLQGYFIRDVKIYNVLYMGDPSRQSMKRAKGDVRISTRVSQSYYYQLEGLAFAMGVSVSSACSALLWATLQDAELVDQYVQYNIGVVDQDRIQELRKVWGYVDPETEALHETGFLQHLIGEIKETVTDFIIKKWDDM